MKEALSRVSNAAKRLGRQALGLIPSRLPVGVTEFEEWAQSIQDTYTLPTSDRDSIRFTLATIIMHLGQQSAYKPKLYFALTMHAAAAKQVAGSVFYDIKQRQKEEQEKAAKAEAEKASASAS